MRCEERAAEGHLDHTPATNGVDHIIPSGTICGSPQSRVSPLCVAIMKANEVDRWIVQRFALVIFISVWSGILSPASLSRPRHTAQDLEIF